MPTPDFNFPVEDYNATTEHPVLVSMSENSVEQRRLVSDKSIYSYSITLPFMGQSDAAAVVQFYQAKKGSLTGFTFMCPFRNTLINVRFDGELTLNHSRGTFRIRCKLVQLANSEVV